MPLKKSGSPNVMCRAPAANLRAHVGQHDVGGDDPKAAVVNRHDRAVPAAMLAPAAGLGVTGGPPLAAHLQRRVARERRRPLARGHAKLQPRRCRHRAASAVVNEPSAALGEPAGSRLATDLRPGRASNSPPRTTRHTVLAQQPVVQRRVETVGDQSSRWIDARGHDR